jgi:hypothetical protein
LGMAVSKNIEKTWNWVQSHTSTAQFLYLIVKDLCILLLGMIGCIALNLTSKTQMPNPILINYYSTQNNYYTVEPVQKSDSIIEQQKLIAIQSETSMNYKPFIDTVQILITRAQIDNYPPNRDKVLTCLIELQKKYTKLLKMSQPEMTKGQLMNIVRTLEQYERAIIKGEEKGNGWQNRAVNFLTYLYLNPLQYPISYMMTIR